MPTGLHAARNPEKQPQNLKLTSDRQPVLGSPPVPGIHTHTHTRAYKHTRTHRLQLANGFDQGKTVSQEATLHIDENHCDFVASLHVRAGVCEVCAHFLTL